MFPLGKAIEKQIRTIEDQGIKQVVALKALKPEENRELKLVDELFLKKIRNIEIKMKQIQLKNGKKLSEKTLYIKQTNINKIFNNMKQ